MSIIIFIFIFPIKFSIITHFTILINNSIRWTPSNYFHTFKLVFVFTHF